MASSIFMCLGSVVQAFFLFIVDGVVAIRSLYFLKLHRDLSRYGK